MTPAPLPSPEPLDIDATPSGVHRLVRSTAWHTKIQWGVVGGFILAAGSFVAWSLNKLDVVNVAMAQSTIQSRSNADEIVVVKQRIESVDSGTRLAVERLERKIDAQTEAMDRKLDRILAEVKKR